MSEEKSGRRFKGIHSDPIIKGIQELLLIKPKDPFQFLAGYFHHVNIKTEKIFLAFEILNRNFTRSADSLEIGQVFIGLSESNLGVKIKDVLG